MKLKITFGDDYVQSVEHQWDDKATYDDNMRHATIKAMDAGLTLDMMRQDKVRMEAIKERDGERCPCCGRELK